MSAYPSPRTTWAIKTHILKTVQRNWSHKEQLSFEEFQLKLDAFQWGSAADLCLISSERSAEAIPTSLPGILGSLT